MQLTDSKNSFIKLKGSYYYKVKEMTGERLHS